jgi:hypothetical protein
MYKSSKISGLISHKKSEKLSLWYKRLWDHPFKTSALFKGGGVFPLPMYANLRGVGVSGMPMSAMSRGFLTANSGGV